MMAQQNKDQDIINFMLISLKHLKALFNTFSQEAGTCELYEKVDSIYETISELQRETYDFMIEQNWMQVEAQAEAKIEKAAKKLQKQVSSMA